MLGAQLKLANPLTKGVQHPYNPPCEATVPKVFKG